MVDESVEKLLQAEAAVERLQLALFYRRRLAEVELTPPEVLYTMGRISDDDAVFLAITKTIQNQLEVEQSAVMAPGTEGVRDYNSGRAAGVSDMLSILLQMRAAGQRRNAES
jgi:hypothetical protein